ncbi:hypothetical protein CN918_29135 [Priestia megaterium]|nr:hypothetical protein CN918_29135 [Priestia megaterium]
MTPLDKIKLAQRLLQEVQDEVKSQEFIGKGPDHELVSAAMSAMTSEIDETADLFYKMKQVLSYIPPATTK